MSTILPIAFQHRLTRWPARLAMAWVLGSTSGCAMLGGMANVVASTTANLLVFVNDSAALEKLLTMPAAKWFASKDELLKTYPNALTIKSWELVPQQVLQLNEEALGSPRVAGMVLFADYLTPGDHRAQLPLGRVAFLVDLNERSFSVKTKPR